MTLIEERAETALWLVAAAVAFAVWQLGTWIIARGRWQGVRERGIDLPAPRLMGDLADHLAWCLKNLLAMVIGFLPILAGLAWSLFCLFWIGVPLWFVHGPAVGAIGATLVWGLGTASGIAVLVRIGERRREEQQRQRARIEPELQADGGRVGTP